MSRCPEENHDTILASRSRLKGSTNTGLFVVDKKADLNIIKLYDSFLKLQSNFDPLDLNVT